MNEDEHGHAIDPDGQLVYDPRCWFCRYSTEPADDMAVTS